MKIAVGIIGLVLGLIVLLQSCAVATGGKLGGSETLFQSGSVGVLVAVLTFLGGAFAFGLPLVSTGAFALATLFAFAVSAEFPDMRIWAFVTLLLAVLSFFAWRSARTNGLVVKAAPPPLPSGPPPLPPSVARKERPDV